MKYETEISDHPEEDDETMRARLQNEWAARYLDWQERQSEAARRKKEREERLLREILPKEFLDD
jgi:Skp family chaperone for outer membrane proteins